ncbi:MAG: hypothetical protein OHK0039_16130 [Bacteroidia bacterium]
MRDLGLRKDHPSRFNIEVERGDSLFLHCPACETLKYLQKNRLRMTLTSPDGSETITLTEANLRQGIRTRYEGVYVLEVQMGGGLTSTYLPIDELGWFRGPKRQHRDSTLRHLDLQHLYVGDEGGNNKGNPRFVLSVHAGDSLYLNAASDNPETMQSLRVEVKPEGQEQGAMLTFEEGAKGILFQDTRNYEIRFSIERKNLWDLSNDYFSLSARRVPEAVYKPRPGSSSQVVEPGGEEKPTQEEALAELLQQLIPQPTPGLVWVNGQFVEHDLPAELQIKRSNCRCIPLDAGEAAVMVFWLGVGAPAEAEFKELETYHARRAAGGETDLLGMYARSVLVEGQPNGRLFTRPDAPDIFAENIEFLITDEAGSEAFLEGRTPAQVFYPAGKVPQAYGHLPANTGTLYYACMRNPNRLTPVHFTFKYQLFDQEQATP